MLVTLNFHDRQIALRREAERCRKRASTNELERDRADKRVLEVEKEVATLTQKLRDDADRYNELAKKFSEKDSVHAASLRDVEAKAEIKLTEALADTAAQVLSSTRDFHLKFTAVFHTFPPTAIRRHLRPRCHSYIRPKQIII